MQGNCFSQINCLSNKQCRFNHFSNRFQCASAENSPRKGVLTPRVLKHSVPVVFGNVSEHGYARHPFSILVTFRQSAEIQLDEETKRFFFVHEEKKVDYGQKMMDPYELKQTLSGILDKFMADNSEIRIDIRHTGEYGYIVLRPFIKKYFLDMQSLIQQAAESDEANMLLKRTYEDYPESAFDDNGNISYWTYDIPHLTRSFTYGSHPGGSLSSGIKENYSFNYNVKNRYVADLVNFMFTWIDQDEKTMDFIPLAPAGKVEKLKIFVEPDTPPTDSAVTRLFVRGTSFGRRTTMLGRVGTNENLGKITPNLHFFVKTLRSQIAYCDSTNTP